MSFFILLLIWPSHVLGLQHVVRKGVRLAISDHSVFARAPLYSSAFDENLVDLNLLSRAELQTLSKEYGLKATGKTSDMLQSLERAISLINDADKQELPSETQILKVSPLEKGLIVNTVAEVSSKYGVENRDIYIGDILKDQGVKIDDLMALRDSLMRGGFKFNEEDEDDFEDSAETLSDEDIDREFYGEKNEFGGSSEPFENVTKKSVKGGVGSSKTAEEAIASEAEKSAANTLKSRAIKEAKLLLKLEGKTSKPRKVEQKVKPPSAEYVKKAPRLADWEYNKLKQQQMQDLQQSRDIGTIHRVKSDQDAARVTEIKDSNSEARSEQMKSADSEVSVEAAAESIRMTAKVATESTAANSLKSLSPPLAHEEPVYMKLKRREEEFEDEDGDELLGDRVGDFDSLEALEDRMDELYGALDSEEERVAVQVQKGSDSSNPIKWRNGRLVNDKDRFLGKIKLDEGEGKGEVEGGDAMKIAKKSTSSKKVVVELTGVTMKNMLEHLETTIGFDGLFEETNLRCFSVKPSVNSALKVLRQLPLEWARKKIEYLYIQSKKRQ